ncbi:MAG: ParA family protein [Bacteroidota bacterium]
MLTLSIAIQKGGSGKTTTAVNLAAALQQTAGKKVLLVDLDPQANLTQALGLTEEPDQSIYQLFRKEAMGEEAVLRDIIVATEAGLDLVPSSLDLAQAELELVSIYGREKLLSRMLEGVSGDYDYAFIDCPPAIGMLTVNGLVASQQVLMPLQAEFLPLKGVKSFMRTFERIQKQLNPQLEILGFVLTKYDQRKNMNRQVLDQLMSDYGSKVFETRIRTNIALAQAQEKGLDIFHHKPNSHGAQDYMALASEFLAKTR